MTTAEDLRAQARRVRAEADELRRLAALLDRSHVHELTRLSGEQTWLGPTASELAAAVARGREALERTAADLRREAVRSDDEASDLDRAARLLLLAYG